VRTGCAAVKPASTLLLGRPFLESAATALLRGLESPHLILALRYETRNFDWTSVSVDGNEREIARVGVTAKTRLKILGFDSHSDFHRRAPDEIHAALHYHKVAEMDWLAEIDSIDRRGYADGSRMPNGADGGGRIHHREYDAAEHETEVVGVLRQHHLRRLVLRFLYSPGVSCRAHCRWVRLAAGL
jgi:hypothetical protein